MLCFFFSSRRRHTRYIGDWSSDVCSSDLAITNLIAILEAGGATLASVVKTSVFLKDMNDFAADRKSVV